MARPPKPGPTGPRVTINTDLSASFVDGYWKNLSGISQNYWMTKFSPAQRYELVLNNLIEQMQAEQEKLNGE